MFVPYRFFSDALIPDTLVPDTLVPDTLVPATSPPNSTLAGLLMLKYGFVPGL
jgi:hypothetical protein